MSSRPSPLLSKYVKSISTFCNHLSFSNHLHFHLEGRLPACQQSGQTSPWWHCLCFKCRRIWKSFARTAFSL